jgi:hypothetical protein
VEDFGAWLAGRISPDGRSAVLGTVRRPACGYQGVRVPVGTGRACVRRPVRRACGDVPGGGAVGVGDHGRCGVIKRREAIRARRETTVLALLAYRPGGWSATELHKHVDGSLPALCLLLESLQDAGKVKAWWVDEPYPRLRLYDLTEAAGLSEDLCNGMSGCSVVTGVVRLAQIGNGT